MKKRIYIDTSVVGGFFDEEFETETKALFEQLKNKEAIFVISDVLIKELKNAPQQVKELLDNYNDDCFEFVKLTTEAETLANYYIAEKIVGTSCIEDCLHIAIATIN